MIEPALPFARADGERWHVGHTRPRCEKKFADLLRAEQMAHYLPLITSVRKYGRQTKRFTKPLFAGYVFGRIPLERRARVFQRDLLARLIPIDNEAGFLRQLDAVRAIVASGLELSLHPLIHRGTRVRVIGGPLQGLEGVVDNPADPQGIVLAVDVLQQGLLVRIPLENLRPLP
jgi:transcription antitermination factor NusG